MVEPHHLGGGRKGLFLLLRYVFIIAASYLVLFENAQKSVTPSQAAMIAMALASNVCLSQISPGKLFSWYVEAPILVADTLWVSWALNTTGAIGQEFFLLYFFVLFLAATGRNLAMVLLGAILVSAANVYLMADTTVWTSPHLLRVAFFFAVALFYSHVIQETRQERERADKGFAWARGLEAQVAARTAELQLLYEQAKAASIAKSALVANMSHELRTPLNIIMGYGEMLFDRHTASHDAESAGLAWRVRGAAGTLLRLVDSILDLGKLEAGKMPVALRTFPLARLAGDLQQRERMPIPPQVRLVWEIPSELPDIVTDPEKLTIVLDNLINNAIKFTAEGSITVSIRDLPARREVELEVADTGGGIDAQHLAAIFQPFHQIDGSVTKRHGGVGLGLAIVESYVGLLGGRVGVESTLGHGSTFTVTMPYGPSERGPGEIADEPSPTPATHPSRTSSAA